MIWTKAFWKGVAERAVKTFAQSGAAAVAVEATGNLAGVADVSWWQVGGIAVLATILSVATSIGNADFTAGVTPVKTVGE